MLTYIQMFNRSLILLGCLFLLRPTVYGQTQLQEFEAPFLGNKQIGKVVKQFDGAQKVVLTVYYANIPSDATYQLKAFIATGGQTPMRDINAMTLTLNSGSGSLDLTFNFTPQGKYTVGEVSSRFVVLAISKQAEEGGLGEILESMGVDTGGGMDPFAQKYVYRMQKNWLVVGTSDEPDAISEVVVPVRLIPFRTAQYIQP